MSVRQFVFSLLIKLGGVSEAKAGAAEVQRAVARVTDETKTAIPVVDRETSATRKNADARRDAAKAAREQAEAERKAREAAQRAVGGTVPGAPSGGGIPNPMPGGGIPTSPAVSPWAMTAEQAALRAQVEPAFAALQQYRQELALVAKAETEGAITKTEAAAAQQRLRVAYDRTTEGIRRGDAAFAGATRAIRLQAHEARNLSYQMSDLFQGVVLGMPPMMILMQQGPQIVDIFGGVGNTLRYVGQQLTATRVLMGGTAAAVIGGAMAWERYVRSLKAAELAAATGGRRLGVSAGMIGATADDLAQDGTLSRSAARDLISQLAGSGMISPDLFGGIAGISKDFGATMGIEADAVGVALVKAFSAPGETAERLRKEGGYILAQDVERIQRLEAQNRLYEAQAVLLDAIKPRLADAAEAQSAIGRSVSGTSRRFGNIWDSFGRMVDDAWEGMPAISANPWVSILAAPTTAREVASKRAARQAAETEAALAGRPEEEGRRLGILAGVAAARAPANTNIRQERTLADDITAMRAGLAADDLSAEARAEITRAIESQSRALDALINRRERALTLDRLDLQIATERDPLRRAELAGLKALMDGYGKGTPFEDWLADAQRARRQALSETLAASSNQAASMQEEAAARERLLALRASGAVTAASADEWLDRELALRPLITAATRAEGDEKTQLEEVIAGLQAAYERLTKAREDAASQDEAEASRQRLADLRLETELIGRSAADRIRAQAAHDVEKRILDMDLDPKSEAAAARRAEAMAEAEARILRDRRQREYDLDTQRMLARYDATARLAPDPISRAAIEAEREYARAIAEGADATEAAAQAALVRSRALSEQQGALQDALRAQDDQIARLQLEIALAGSSEAASARALAVYDAEMQARRMGYEVGSLEAEMMRDGARAAADLTTELERQRDAWDKVHRAAEGMIDGPIDALLKGDLKGALASFAQEFMGLYTELAWKNPVKNKLLGTNYATLDDVGGLGGIVGRLFGGAQAEP
ncbi:phage tail length tape measure family protein, partial [Ruixingdingia sedimenti]